MYEEKNFPFIFGAFDFAGQCRGIGNESYLELYLCAVARDQTFVRVELEM